MVFIDVFKWYMHVPTTDYLSPFWLYAGMLEEKNSQWGCLSKGADPLELFSSDHWVFQQKEQLFVLDLSHLLTYQTSTIIA